MKLTTRDLSVFLIGIAATFLSIFGYHHFIDDRNPFERLSSDNIEQTTSDNLEMNLDHGKGNGKGGSKRVSFSALEKSLKEYMNSKRVLMVEYFDSVTQSKKVDTLEAFTFSAIQLDSIINKNESGKTPTQVMFYIGSNGKFDYQHKTYSKMTLTAIGMLNGQLIYKNPSDTTNNLIDPDESIYDQADPSPPFGPSNSPNFTIQKIAPKRKN